jgi:polyphosphate glucokinase
VHVVNDADAAGMAEMKFGSGRGFKGVALLVTVGTGLGTVLFTNGRLMPNMEMGHITLRGDDAEKYASDAARKTDKISWEKWASITIRWRRKGKIHFTTISNLQIQIQIYLPLI